MKTDFFATMTSDLAVTYLCHVNEHSWCLLTYLLSTAPYAHFTFHDTLTFLNSLAFKYVCAFQFLLQ